MQMALDMRTHSIVLFEIIQTCFLDVFAYRMQPVFMSWQTTTLQSENEYKSFVYFINTHTDRARKTDSNADVNGISSSLRIELLWFSSHTHARLKTATPNKNAYTVVHDKVGVSISTFWHIDFI